MTSSRININSRTNTGRDAGMKMMVPAIAVAALLFGACGSDDGTAGAAEAASTGDDVAEPAGTVEQSTTTATPATTPATSPATTDAPPPTEAPAEPPVFTAQDAIDVVVAIGQAYNTFDAGLFMEVAAEDFQFVDERGTADRATQASYFPALREGRHQGQRVGDPVVISEDPFVVAEDVVITAEWYEEERVGTSTYTLVVEDGELKVLEHRWTGDLL